MKKRVLFLIFGLCLSIASFAQVQVSGSVSDSQGEPIPGVTVLEKGTQNGVITDIDGNYNLSVAGQESVLVFSFVGMQTQEVTVGGQTTIDVVLSETFTDLDEVVVVGYGVQKKKLTTGANLNVGGDDLQKQSTGSALEAMQSQAPGMNITQSSGQPGEGFKVNIRGLGTIGNPDPLYVIDGVAGGNINNLNPSDIESIDVLKDAASAAIYGSRAANGVILVTTKQGRAGKIEVTYDGYYGVQDIENIATPLNASQFMEILNEERVTSEKSPEDFAGKIPELYQKVQSGEWNGTNWMDEAYNENAPTQNHAINISGGSEQSVFSMGFSYYSQEGVFGKPVEPNFERITARLNSDHVVYENNGRDVIKVGQTFNYSYSKKAGIAIGGMYWNDVRNMLVGNPLVPLYNDEGEYFNYDNIKESGLDDVSSRIYNPIAQMHLERGMNESHNYNVNGDVHVEIQPIEDLIFRSSFGYRSNSNRYRSYQPEFSLAGDVTHTPGNIIQSAGSGHDWTLENTLNYSFNVNLNSFDVLVGQSVEKTGIGYSMEANNGYPNFIGYKYAYLDNTQGITPGVTTVAGTPYDQGRLSSFFGRVNFDHDETYLLTMVMRADASSNFAEGNRWGYFPSVSAGWVMTEEDFLGNNDVVEFLKLRASWGQNGNQAITPFQYLALIGSDKDNNYRFGDNRGEMQQGAFPSILPNEDVSWETSEQLDLGFDAHFLRGRLRTAFDYYVKTTKDWLVREPLPDIFGAPAGYYNGGEIENSGIELALNWNDNLGDFSYGAQFNISTNKNEVTYLGNASGFIQSNSNVISQQTEPVWRVETGMPVGYFYGYKTDGIFQDQQDIDSYADNGYLQGDPQPGDVKFVDVTGDGVVNDEDRTMIGNPHPDVRIGFGLNFAYKGFDFSVTGKGAFGHEILQSYRSFADNEFHNYTTEILEKRWTPENPSNSFPRLTAGNSVNRMTVSDIYIHDGDFIKIQNLTIGYDFKKLLPDMPLGQARLYVAGRNLVTFTDYSGMDPEVGYGDEQPFVSGIDLGFYPSPRTYLVGLNLKF
ncbi:SusC/RagA family TonB-linked outer membrane protein [Marinilabilia salmonicolor]|uniref:SusC/RagA family TonB-linked outer membrane protein n=1 Tax=Marinilabilia salmonicolor TaxID=989 RepID=UPI00029A9983|nr:TonB-dependent receptor [Marinilabilia salmonicolor]